MKNILVVDDSPTSLFDIRKKLSDLNLPINAIACENYDQAIIQLEKGGVDLAIVDLQMPVKNGADLIMYMNTKSTLKDIPVFILTGTGENSLLKTSLEEMVEAYLHKPVDIHTLKENLMKFF